MEVGRGFEEYLLFKHIFNWSSCFLLHFQVSSVHSLSHVWLFVTPWTVAHKASLSITSSQSLLKLMSIVLVIFPRAINSWAFLENSESFFPSALTRSAWGSTFSSLWQWLLQVLCFSPICVFKPPFLPPCFLTLEVSLWNFQKITKDST